MIRFVASDLYKLREVGAYTCTVCFRERLRLTFYSKVVSGLALICAAIPEHIQFYHSELIAQSVRIRTGKQN